MIRIFVILGILCLCGCNSNSFTSDVYAIPPITTNDIDLSNIDKNKSFQGECKPIIRIRAIVQQSEHSSTISSGTGFIIERNNKKYIITAYHVVKEYIRLEFQTSLRQNIDISLGDINHFPELDTSVLEIKEISAKITPLKTSGFHPGEKVKVIGFPLNGSYTESVGTGLRSRIESDAFTEVGMSGGPVLDKNGDVIGVVSMKIISDGVVGGLYSRLEDVLYSLDQLK